MHVDFCWIGDFFIQSKTTHVQNTRPILWILLIFYGFIHISSKAMQLDNRLDEKENWNDSSALHLFTSLQTLRFYGFITQTCNRKLRWVLDGMRHYWVVHLTTFASDEKYVRKTSSRLASAKLNFKCMTWSTKRNQMVRIRLKT